MGGIFEEVLVIPPSIGKLKKLQTICGSIHYPSDHKFLCELKELRHLMFSDNKRNLNIGSDQPKLQTIRKIMYTEWKHIDTMNLTNLHTLVINEDEGGGEEEAHEYNFEYMANLTSLRTLHMLFRNSVISTIQPLPSCKHPNRVTLMGRIKVRSLI